MKGILTLLLLAACLPLPAQVPQWICLQDTVSVYPMDPINTASIEFAPTYYGAGLVFVMARENIRFLDPTTGRAYFDLMYSELGPDGRGSRPVNFSPNIRTQYHEGPCVFSADGHEIYFTRSNVTGGQGVPGHKGQVQLQLFHAVKGPEDWEQIESLPFNSSEYSIAHPALSPDGHFLVFSSNMPDGLGGMDLYIVRHEAGGWGEPQNLGPGINSKGNEAFPVWHPQGYLIYASDGLGGRGGLDLFIARTDPDGMIGRVQHLPEPFNSKKDDLGLILNADGTAGYFASSRKPGKGKDDLYGWSSASSIFCTPEAPAPMLVGKDILVLNDNSEPLEKAYAWLLPLTADRKAAFEEHFQTRLVPDPGNAEKFLFEWRMTDSLDRASADDRSDADGLVHVEADPRLSYGLAVQREGYGPVVMMVNGDQLPSVIRLKSLTLDGKPCREIQFDVFDESGNRGLEGARILVEGDCPALPVSATTNIAGQAVPCLPAGCNMRAVIEKDGFATHSFAIDSVGEKDIWKVYLRSSTGLTGPAAPIASGTVIVLNNIYYDFNKSEIRKGDAAELISLARVMKQYPDLRIEMTAHTDTRGSADYNLELSRRRAEAAKSYLVQLGIRGDRILTAAAGESAPRNRCVDGVPCSEEEHQYNRRTEVRIMNPAEGMEVRYRKEP